MPEPYQLFVDSPTSPPLSPDQPIANLAEAVARLAEATEKLAAQHERLWDALPPRTRAKLLGLSTRGERARRKRAELQNILRAT